MGQRRHGQLGLPAALHQARKGWPPLLDPRPVARSGRHSPAATWSDSIRRWRWDLPVWCSSSPSTFSSLGSTGGAYRLSGTRVRPHVCHRLRGDCGGASLGVGKTRRRNASSRRLPACRESLSDAAAPLLLQPSRWPCLPCCPLSPCSCWGPRTSSWATWSRGTRGRAGLTGPPFSTSASGT